MKTGIIHLILATAVTRVLVIQMAFFEDNAFNALGVLVLTFALLWLTSIAYNRSYFKKLPKLMDLFLYFMKEWVMSILKVAQEILTKKIYMNPAVIAVPLKELTDFELTFLVNTIILTPSTLSVDVSDDRRTVYVHTFFVPEGGKAEFIRDIEDGFQDKLLAVTR